MKYRVELEQMIVDTSHFRIQVEVEAESNEEALEAAFEEAERADLTYRHKKPKIGEWRRSHDHHAKSIEVVDLVSQPS